MRTTAAGVSAIGDLVGPLLLAHAASEQGVIAVEAMAGRRDGTRGLDDPTRVPMCVYCQPEVAAVGLDRGGGARAGRGRGSGKFPFRALGKAMATGHTTGFVKVVAGARYGEILGVHMIGHGVTELDRRGRAGADARGDDARAASTPIHAHPTLAEALREAALAAEGEAINI